MGAHGSKTPRAVLQTDVQLYFKAGHVKKVVENIIGGWFNDGTPLGLTKEMFRELLHLDDSIDLDAFFAAFDTDGNRKVDAFEVLCAAVILADGTLDEKLTAIFNIFDFAGDGKLNFDEAHILLHSFCRGVSKVCSMEPIADTDIVEATRQLFDGFNIPYSAQIRREQVLRWVRQDIEATKLLLCFHRARSLAEVQAALAEREQAQADVFAGMCGSASSVPAQTLASSSAFRASLDDPPESDLRHLMSLLGGPDGAGDVQPEGFAQACQAWNSFSAVDLDQQGSVEGKNLFLLLWYREHQEPSPDSVEAERERLGACEISRAAWLAACLGAPAAGP